MARRDIVVIGGRAGLTPAAQTVTRRLLGSAGSTGALKVMAPARPKDFAASVFLVTHAPTNSATGLAAVLASVSALPVGYAEDGEPILPGRVRIGPAGRHMILQPTHLSLGRGPRENLVRPSIDPLFRSAALRFGPRVIGVVLSGYLNDGAAGLAAVKQRGGLALVQDPDDATTPDMPNAAIAAAEPHQITDAARLGAMIAAHGGEEVSEEPLPVDVDLELEVEIAEGTVARTEEMPSISSPTALICPDCGGALAQVSGEGRLRFRCQIGHAVTADILEENKLHAVEDAVRTALRIMEERITLVRRMARDADAAGRTASAGLYRE